MDRKRIIGIDSEFEIDFKERCGMSIGDIPNILDFSVDRQLCECANIEDNPKVQKDIDQKEELLALNKGLEDIENGRTRPLKEAIDGINLNFQNSNTNNIQLPLRYHPSWGVPAPAWEWLPHS